MALYYILFAAVITALANLLIRRGLDVAKDAKGDPFIIHRFLTAACIMIPIILYRHGHFPINTGMVLVGVAGGLALGLLQYSLGRCLHYGPPALSFIFVSAACVVPPLLLFFIFGEEFGHGYSLYNLVGSLLVLMGLFWMAKSQGLASAQDFKRWGLWVAIAFLGGILHQFILEWRALLMKENLPPSTLLPFHCSEAEGDFYIIASFCTAALCQKLFTTASLIVKTSRQQVLLCGLVGGILNGVSLFFLMRGAELAETDMEKAIIFPAFTVLLITLCNSWASLLYKEKVNWPANALCMAGIIVAMR